MAAFLGGYREATAGGDTPHAHVQETFLRAYLLEKALYEIMYEVNNRPDWIAIPLSGILDLLQTADAPVAFREAAGVTK